MRIVGGGTAAGEDAGALAGLLRAVDLFAPLSDEQLRRVLFFVKTVEFDEGETVFERGEEGDSFYLVVTGAAEARAPGALWGTRLLKRMGPGEFFGELALLLSQPRAATVVCPEATTCLRLDRTDFELLLEGSSDIAAAVKATAKARFDSGR